MFIERITSKDAARLVPLNAIVQNLHAEMRPDIFKDRPLSAQVSKLFRTALENPMHFALIAVSSERRDLGYAYCEVLLTPEDALTHARRRGVLHHIAVAETARRQGIGSRLIEAAKDEFRRAGAEEWTASYHVWNEASSALLRRAGLAPTIIRAEGRL